MQKHKPTLAPLIVLLLMMGASMNADAGLFGHTMNWKEEVLLHDGSMTTAIEYALLAGASYYDTRADIGD